MNGYQNISVEYAMPASPGNSKPGQGMGFYSLNTIRTMLQKFEKFIGRKNKTNVDSVMLDCVLPETGNPMLDLYYLEGMKLFRQGPYSSSEKSSELS